MSVIQFVPAVSSMSNRSHENVFDADDVAIMSEVLTAISSERHFDVGSSERDVLADKVLRLYSNGTHDPDILKMVLRWVRV